ncbi:MAG: glutamine-hydrolyzing GMP synthase [Acidimicrobiaceae bacterium]|nr:glutamine-hydrolyzing GMP synthase [Acidimicrobiaceae bacterium]MDE0677474.1 glutamine-hydrolyzing GMP synthase [Acidimicrobiaceae bacterium]
MSTHSPAAGAVAHPTVLVVDFGAQYAQLIARRVREAQVYSEIVPHTATAAELAERSPAAIIFSGGPASVHVDGAPGIDPGVYELGVPILGICYGHQLLSRDLGGQVGRSGRGEYGRTTMTHAGVPSELLGEPGIGVGSTEPVWMSHFDAVVEPPDGFAVTASTADSPAAVIEDPQRRFYGVQHHPEVAHTPSGQAQLERFLHGICGINSEWTMANVITESVEAIRAQVGSARAICGLSGGVDSAVAAALTQRAIGSQLTCVFVDTGLMRAGEGEQVTDTFRRTQGIELIHERAADEFFEALAGVTDPEDKRKIIGEKFVRIFERAAGGITDARFLVQGTLYPDVIESGSPTAAKIKSHHNVGGLPEDMTFELVEPLRNLFKDEVRAVGTELGLPAEIVQRQPFPGPGLGVRIVGEVTPEAVETVRAADVIVRDEITKAGLDGEVWQGFAVLADIRSVGVMGDERTYARPIIVRAVTSEDAMTADWARLPHDLLELISSRIVNEVPGVNRVVYDITSKPPGTIEWE